MGATCGPCVPQDDEQRDYNMDINEAETIEKFTKIIRDYQASNDALKKELEECKCESTDNEERAKQNEEVMKELAEMKALVDAKNAMLARGRLESALLSKATAMLADGSATKICMRGRLRVIYRSGTSMSRKYKWVEIYVSEGKLLADDYAAGWVALTYSDSKDSITSTRCQVVEVIPDDTNNMEFIFTVKLMVQGELMNDMMFSCESVEERDEWVNNLKAALADVSAAYESMHEDVTVKVKFEKDKLGFRVAENLIRGSDEQVHDEKIINEVAKESEAVKKVVEQVAQIIEKEVQAKVGDKNDEANEATRDTPCQLTVCHISDETLYDAGVKENFVLCAINDIVLPGKGYKEQLNLLTKTPKPLHITFRGKIFIKRNNDHGHGYTSILKELVADGENAVKTAFNELIKGTPFEEEMNTSNDRFATITALLANRRRLLALLHNVPVNEIQL